MVTFQHRKQQVLEVFQEAISISQDHKQPEIENHLVEAQKHLADGKLFVVVCGEFKQGKSSLLNALLNEPGLFPVDVDITTNLVSTITYAKEENITVVLGEPGKEQREKVIQRNEISDYVTEQRNKQNAKKARMLVIESSNPILKEGLVLVDTPGAGSLSTEHTAITYAFIPNADAILFVSDALTPLTTEEFKFLKKTIAPHCQNLIFVITKIDTLDKDKSVDFIKGNREKLAQVLNRPPEQIPIVAVSNTSKLDYLKYQDPEDLEDSHFEELEQELWGLIGEQRGQILLVTALTELSKAVNELKNPIQVELAAYQKSPEELQELKNQLQDTKKKLQSLLENNAEWRTQLSDGLQDIRTDILKITDNKFTEINHQAEKYLEDRTLLENPEQIVSLLEADIDGVISTVGKNLSFLATELNGKIETATELELNIGEFDSLVENQNEVDLEDFKSKEIGTLDKVTKMTRNAGFTSSAGAVIGGSIGAAFGNLFLPAIGTLPGAGVGATIGSSIFGAIAFVMGAKEGLSQMQEKNKREVSIKVKQFINQRLKHFNHNLSKAVKDLERSMRDQFNQQLKRKKQDYDRTIKSLQEACKVSESQIVQKVKSLQIPLQKLHQLENKIEQLLKITIEQPIVSHSPKPEVKPQAETIIVEAKEVAKQPTAVVADYGDWADE